MIESVALEIWALVFSYLANRDLLHCAMTCQNFAIQAQKYLFEELRYIEGYASSTNVYNMSALLQTLEIRLDMVGYVRNVVLMTSNASLVDRLLQILHKSPIVNLESLEIQLDARSSSLSPKPFELTDTSLKPWCRLKTLAHVGPVLRYISAISPQPKNQLHSIRLINTSREAAQIKVSYLKNLVNLGRLELQNVADSTISLLLAASSQSLYSVHLEDCRLDFTELPVRLPNLRDIHIQNNCEIFIGATGGVAILSIFENHRPLQHINRYSTACQRIKKLYIIENMGMDFHRTRGEIVEIFKGNLLPSLEELEVGTWETLESILSLLPPTTRRIDLQELDFSYCPHITTSIIALLHSRPHPSSLSIHIHVDDNYGRYLAIRSQLPLKWIGGVKCKIYWEKQIIWASHPQTPLVNICAT